MEGSTFGRLPPELRNRIYHFVLVQDGLVTIHFDSKATLVDTTGDTNLLALTQTCQSIRQESRGILYGRNHFRFVLGRRPDITDDGDRFRGEQIRAADQLERWAREMGEQTLRQMRTIHLMIRPPTNWEGTYPIEALATMTKFFSNRGTYIASRTR